MRSNKFTYSQITSALCLIFLTNSSFSWSAAAQISMPNDDEAENKGVEKVIIYGQKLERTLKETANSVRLITADDIKKNADQATISEILRGTANITFASNTDAPIIRGTDTKGPVSNGNAYLSKPVPSATISVDGRYLTSSELGLGAAGLWDVTSVEVFRGPQTTSQGANSIAGAVVIKTNTPTFTPEFALQSLVGSRNKVRISALASGPLSDDFAARIAVDYSSRDTFVTYTNPEFTAHDFDLDFKNKDLRAKLLWQPSAFDGLSSMLTYAYNEVKRPRNEIVTAPYGNLENSSLYQDNQVSSSNVGLWDLEYEFDNGITLSNQAQYSEGDYDYNFAEPYAGIAIRTNKNLSDELTLNIKDEQNKYQAVAGLFYWKDKTNNILNNTFGQADADLEHESIAAYGELAWHFTAKWELTTGLRYQKDTISHEGMATYVPDQYYVYEKTFDTLLPKLSLTYKINDTINVGALVNKGYIPGGTGLNFRAGEYYTFDEEYAWNYEIFTRAELFNKKLTIDANVFYTQFKDSQRAVTDYLDGRPFGTIIVNADEASSYGVELNAMYAPSESVSLYGGIGLLETEISKFEDFRGESFVGNEFSKAPGYMFNLGTNYKITDELLLDINMRYSDSYYSSDTNEPELRVSGYTVLNMNASYQFSEMTEGFIYARNALDKHAPLAKFSDRSTQSESAYLLEPRELGIGVRMNF